jgi:hypothetical protein
MATEALNVVLPFHFRYARDAGDLGAIHAPGVNLVVWRREQEPQMSGLVDAFNSTHELDVEAILQSDEPDVWMFLSDLPACGARDMLAADIEYLVRRFGNITGCPSLRVHLETVTTNACRLFHVDAAALRLLVTYSGFGTQWVTNDNVRREQLMAQGRSFEAANRAIVSRPGQIRSCRPWWVMVQKGESYPGNAGNGFVHRSPPIEMAGERRLRLCIDEVKR